MRLQGDDELAAKNYFGIDLGTTYSCIACVKGGSGEATVLSNSESEQTTPSVVFFENADNVVVGNTAKEELRAGSDQAIARAKQFMGTDKQYHGHRPEALTPQEISAYILRKLVQDAAAQVDGEVTDVVITCPAYFGLDAKAATQEAGELAGLTVHYVIPEPVAAAYYYATSRGGSEGSEEKTLLVYDLGGGTFDATVIRTQATEIRELGIEGDARLGGDDWDSMVATWFAEEIARATGKSADEITENDVTMQHLLLKAETSKKQLSARETLALTLHGDFGPTKVTLTREKFDELTRPLLDKTLTLTAAVLGTVRERQNVETIDEVLLVGGSTYMPQVEPALRACLAEAGLDGVPIRRADPHLAVAKGAAWYAHKCAIDGEVKEKIAARTGQKAETVRIDAVPADIRGDAERHVAGQRGIQLSDVKKMTDHRVRNVTAKTFGVKVVDDAPGREFKIANLIMVNTEVPHSAVQELRTVDEGQTAVRVECMEGTSTDPSCPLDEGSPVGSPIDIDFGRPLPRFAPLGLRFELSADGLLSVTATEASTGAVASGEIRTGSIKSIEELERRKAVTTAIGIS